MAHAGQRGNLVQLSGDTLCIESANTSNKHNKTVTWCHQTSDRTTHHVTWLHQTKDLTKCREVRNVERGNRMNGLLSNRTPPASPEAKVSWIILVECTRDHGPELLHDSVSVTCLSRLDVAYRAWLRQRPRSGSQVSIGRHIPRTAFQWHRFCGVPLLHKWPRAGAATGVSSRVRQEATCQKKPWLTRVREGTSSSSQVTPCALKAQTHQTNTTKPSPGATKPMTAPLTTSPGCTRPRT